MKLADMYAAAVRKGMQTDPRGPGVQRALDAARKAYDALPEARRWEFDAETLTNPFVDCRILVGDPEIEVRRILVGIDIGVGEVLLADRLRERGQPIDLILRIIPRAGRWSTSRTSWACRPTCCTAWASPWASPMP